MNSDTNHDLDITIKEAATIRTVASKMHEIASNSGLHDRDRDTVLTIGRVAEFVANLHGEASKLWEAARRDKLFAQCDKPVSLTCAAEELADIVICCMDTAVSLGIDLGEAIALKAAYNRKRTRMHGGKLA